MSRAHTFVSFVLALLVGVFASQPTAHAQNVVNASQGSCSQALPTALTREAILQATRFNTAVQWDIQLSVDGQGKVMQSKAKRLGTTEQTQDELAARFEIAAKSLACVNTGMPYQVRLTYRAEPLRTTGLPIKPQRSWFDADSFNAFPKLSAQEFVLAPVWPSTQYRVDPKPCPLSFKIILRDEGNEVWDLPTLRTDNAIKDFKNWAQKLKRNASADALLRTEQAYAMTLACRVQDGRVLLD